EQRECGDNECVSGITVMLQAPVHLRSGHGPLTLPAPPCFSELVRKAKPNLLAPQADGSPWRGQTHTHTHTRPTPFDLVTHTHTPNPIQSSDTHTHTHTRPSPYDQVTHTHTRPTPYELVTYTHTHTPTHTYTPTHTHTHNERAGRDT